MSFTAASDKNRAFVQHWAIPYENRDVIPVNADIGYNPTTPLQEANAVTFGGPSVISEKGLHMTFGEPPLGDWAYIAVVTYWYEDEMTPRFRTSKRIELPMSTVSIAWSSRIDPLDANITNPTYAVNGGQNFAVPGDILFPEKQTPTAATTDNRLGVILDVFPKVNRALSAPLYLYITDPDNALANTGTNQLQQFDFNDEFQNGANVPNADDNLDSEASHQVPSKEVPGAKFVEGGGRLLTFTVQDTAGPPGVSHEILKVFEVKNPQPGNNWHVAVHDESNVVQEFKYIDASSQGVMLQRDGTRLGAHDLVSPMFYTSMLTAARTLWIEHDVMGPPNNAANAMTRGVFNGEAAAGGHPSCTLNQCDDPLPAAGLYNINLNVLTNVLVPTLVVPMLLPANLNTHSVVPFVHYVGLNDAVAQLFGKNERDVPSAQFFWVVQIVSAYEGDETQDNDIDVGEGGSNGVPDDFPFLAQPQPWQLGYAAGPGTDRSTFIYHEEIRDVIADATGKNVGANAVTFNHNITGNVTADVTSIIVAHETMHRFFGTHLQNTLVTNSGLMSGRNVLQHPNPNNPALGQTNLLGIQVQFVQTRKFPS